MTTDMKIIAALWVALVFNSELPGKFEANIYPVLDNVVIEVKPTANPFKSQVFIEFEKRREYCSFDGMEFYMVKTDADGNEVKTVLNRSHEGEDIIRKGGMNYAGPWIVNASVTSLQNMEIEVKHECHPLWDVTSKFYRDDGVMR